MSQTSTIRQQRTQDHLYRAFIKLVKEKGFHTVSVTDIVKEAKYNRTTFYKHFEDKFDLADALLTNMMKGLEEAVGIPYLQRRKINSSELNHRSFRIVDYFYEQREFFELLTVPDTIPSLTTSLPLTILKIYKEQFHFVTVNDSHVNMETFKRYTAFGFYGIILNWITTNFAQPKKELVEELIELTRSHMKTIEYIGQSSK
ncbi:TetR/AcrR family transcriptional regulator [Lysinibacillus odysseyi]|uniref:TetR family transcriptional regulator n=1 Tax=Lysinibacillus odysseyi 34hs-1 = NBRC 100172 TaxID=1220589 RepID=A0A0A3IB32_9BACI|nr:TetR/AcrR family transcriptional regulator [Lysinibacillus odysseyi]KGR81924.1 TetR family transcriptional regulator [Lysinibacillus odysseyi 34hs-1 = NBRC 100172]